ncbi:MAG: SMC family ATPase [Nanoarchaeota archaeon]|nr:SMC family ATPase [Nanoarchaeota archaeon]
MIIRKVKLRNIRSYLEEEINFPEGSVLLSGDVGSGKSSILLAIDFALFGLTRGVLSGNALLRNGANNGEVELHLEINNKNIVIKRALKRNEKSVTQDSGYVLVDGQKIEGTAIELKAKVLELLNYPKDLLTKSKSLIYRFTVYTPQEEMKRILTEDSEDRLEILRRVFDIDKYKRIQENCFVAIRKIKDRIREGEILTTGLEEKKLEKAELEKNAELLKNEFLELESKIKAVEEKLSEKIKKYEDYEEKIKNLNELKNSLAIVNNNISYKNKEKEKLNNELSKINEEILENEKLLKDFGEENKVEYEEKIKELEEKISIKEAESKKISSRLSEINLTIRNSESLVNQVKNLDKCPTCFQNVNDEHKNKISSIENEKLEKCREELEGVKNNENIITSEIETLRKNLDLFEEKLNQYNIMKVKNEGLKDKKRLKERYESELSLIFDSMGEWNEEVKNLEFEVDSKKNIEENYKIIKKNIDVLNEKNKNLEIKKTSLNERINNAKSNIEKLSGEIFEKISIKERNEKLNEILKWLDEQFLAMMEKMERSVMLRLHKDFNTLFNNWFSILIDNENLTVRLDNEFSPVIVQDGYEIDYEFLSGGEKTAVALAYRLSLNQVINNLMSAIETKDVIILDEPTDGFSSEQLDRVRIVLDELNIKQVIIVSHEDKIESFVDKVMRFEKKANVSRVIR